MKGPLRIVRKVFDKQYRVSRNWRYLGESLRIVFRNRRALSKERVPFSLGWYNGKINFGDALSPILIKTLTGGRSFIGQDGLERRVTCVPRLMALGSILHRAVEDDIIWGSGLRGGRIQISRLQVHAVRGPLTRDLLRESGINCPAVYGDPAILMPYLFRPTKTNQFQVGVISHYSDRSALSRIAGPGICRIRVDSCPLEVIRKICRCEVILSSSLHGLIISEAYGIPAAWVLPQPGCWRYEEEPIFKYHDYFASTQRQPEYFRCGIDTIDIPMAIEFALRVQKPKFDPEPLLLSFPFLDDGIKSLKSLTQYEIEGVQYPIFEREFVRVQ